MLAISSLSFIAVSFSFSNFFSGNLPSSTSWASCPKFMALSSITGTSSGLMMGPTWIRTIVNPSLPIFSSKAEMISFCFSCISSISFFLRSL